jgi:hypothetical protein
MKIHTDKGMDMDMDMANLDKRLWLFSISLIVCQMGSFNNFSFISFFLILMFYFILF